jgi:hypothetical protein
MDELELEVALSLLLGQMEDPGADDREIFLKLSGLLNAMRAQGLPLPDDLVEMERGMGAEFAIDKGKA